jgi:hypothetical protein
MAGAFTRHPAGHAGKTWSWGARRTRRNASNKHAAPLTRHQIDIQKHVADDWHSAPHTSRGTGSATRMWRHIISDPEKCGLVTFLRAA